MYYEPPYATSRLPTAPPAAAQPRSIFRYLLWTAVGICGLLTLTALITLLVLYFVRYRHAVSSSLAYPDFVCGSRPCGCPNWVYQTSLAGKIVGGQDALPFTYPWLVALVDRYTTNSFCTGFIISSNAILTAAHCLIGRNPSQIQILARAHDLRHFSGERYDIDVWFNHPEYRYNNSIHLNDIAVVRTRQPFASDLQPCCLPSAYSSIYPPGHTAAVVSGWGKLAPEPSNRNSPILQHVVMPIVDERNAKCRATIVDTSRQLCAGYTNLPIDTCSGDSGSPLLVVEYTNQRQGHFVAAGIVSYGNSQCDASVSSGIYTRVGFYLPWIRSIVPSV